MCLERFSRINIHNNEYEITVGVVLAKIVDGRVSFYDIKSFLSWKHNLGSTLSIVFISSPIPIVFP